MQRTTPTGKPKPKPGSAQVTTTQTTTPKRSKLPAKRTGNSPVKGMGGDPHTTDDLRRR